MKKIFEKPKSYVQSTALYETVGTSSGVVATMRSRGSEGFQIAPFFSCGGCPVPLRLAPLFQEFSRTTWIAHERIQGGLSGSQAVPSRPKHPPSQTLLHEVARGEAGHVWEGAAKVDGQAVDHIRAPSLLGLPLEDVAADLPVEEDHLAVGCQAGAELGRANAVLELAQELLLALGEQGGRLVGTCEFRGEVALPGHGLLLDHGRDGRAVIRASSRSRAHPRGRSTRIGWPKGDTAKRGHSEYCNRSARAVA